MRLLVLCFSALFLASCATTVTSVKDDKFIKLEQGKGFLLLGIESNRDLKTIFIDGQQSIKLTHKDIRRGTNYLLVDLEAGEYAIERIALDKFWNLNFENEENWTFTVKPNQINYVGHLEVTRRNNFSWILSGQTYTELVNRSTQALTFMKSDYPNLLSSNELVYGGPGQDSFFQFVKAEQEKTND